MVHQLRCNDRIHVCVHAVGCGGVELWRSSLFQIVTPRSRKTSTMSRRLIADPFRGWHLRESQFDVCLRMTTRATWKAMVKNEQEEISCIRHIRQISDSERLKKYQLARAARLVQKEYNEFNAHRQVFKVYNLEKSGGDCRKRTSGHRAPEPDALAATNKDGKGMYEPLQQSDVLQNWTGYACGNIRSKKFRKWSTNCGMRQPLEISTIKDDTSTSKDETETIKDETSTSKDETKTIKDETSTSKDETKTTKDETKTIKDETRTIKKTSSGCVPETTADQSASGRRKKNTSFQESTVEPSSVNRVKGTPWKKQLLPKLNTSIQSESTPHQGYYHHYSYDMLQWIVLNRATSGNMNVMNHPGTDVSDTYKSGAFYRNVSIINHPGADVSDTFKSGLAYRNWSQTLAGVKGLMKWMSRTQAGVDDVDVKTLLRRNARSNIYTRIHHTVFPAHCKTVYALKKLISKDLKTAVDFENRKWNALQRI